MVSLIKTLRKWFECIRFNKKKQVDLETAVPKLLDNVETENPALKKETIPSQEKTFNYGSIKDVMTMAEKSRDYED